MWPHSATVLGVARRSNRNAALLPNLHVDSVREAKEGISEFLHDARELGAETPPKFFGAHRRPEGVFLSYEGFLDLVNKVENQEIAVLAASRSATRGKKSIELDEAMEMLGFDPNEHSLD